MTTDDQISRARAALKAAQDTIREELQSYPTPVSGCDVQYNHLIGQRHAVADALAALATPRFVATPRIPVVGAAVESR